MYELSSPVVGSHSVGRFTSRRFCLVCLGTGEFLRPQGAIPPGFYPLWAVRFIAWRLRRSKKGKADGVEGIFDLAERVWASAFRPDLPLKRPFAIFVRWWDASINKQRSTLPLSGVTQLHEVGAYVIVAAFTSPPLLVVDSTPFFPYKLPCYKAESHFLW